MSGVFFVRSNYPIAEPRATNILSALASFSPTALVWDRTAKEDNIQPDWLVYKNYAPFGPRSLKSFPGWWRFVFSQLRRNKAEVIHVCNIESCLPVYVYCTLFRKKFVYDIWDTAGGMYGGNKAFLTSFLNCVERCLIRKSFATIVPDKERIIQLGIGESSYIAKKILVIPNTQPFSEWHSKKIVLGENKLRLLYTGVLVKEVRGLEWLIDAACQIDGIELTIGGYGSDADYVYKLAQAHNKPTSVKFIGKVGVSELERLYGQTDVIVTLLDPNFPNYRYATSTKAFEAFANGLPVITTEGTATGNLVKDRDWGYVIPFTKEDLTALLRRIITEHPVISLDPSKVKDFDWRVSADVLKNLYSKLA